MRIEQSLVDFFRRDGVVSALTGRSKLIYRGRATQDGGTELQRLHYEVVSDKNDQSVTGGACTSAKAEVLIYCVGRGAQGGYEKARALADAVQNARGGGAVKLKNFGPGWLPPTAPVGAQVWVQCLRLEETLAAEEEQPAGGAVKDIYVCALRLVASYLVS